MSRYCEEAHVSQTASLTATSLPHPHEEPTPPAGGVPVVTETEITRIILQWSGELKSMPGADGTRLVHAPTVAGKIFAALAQPTDPEPAEEREEIERLKVEVEGFLSLSFEWRERAERAEAELARVTKERDQWREQSADNARAADAAELARLKPATPPDGAGHLDGHEAYVKRIIQDWERDQRELCSEAPAADSAYPTEYRAFPIGTRVRKVKGSSWNGRVCGYYSTELTPRGICVESEREPGSVQIYPVQALEVVKDEATASSRRGGEGGAVDAAIRATIGNFTQETIIKALVNAIEAAMAPDIDLEQRRIEGLNAKVRYYEKKERDRDALTPAPTDTGAMRAALEDIISADQIERRKLVDFDPAGSVYEVEEIDGHCARVARAALAAAETTRGRS